MTNELPTNAGYGTVKARFLIAYADGSDIDSFPDGAPAFGNVYFKPSVEKIRNASAIPAAVTIIPTTLVCGIDEEGYLTSPSGSRNVNLLATDDTDNDPTGWTWAVSYKLTDSNGAAFLGIGAHDLSVPQGQVIDLIDFAPSIGLV